MKVEGFGTLIARNRRVAIELIGLYLIAAELMGGLAVSMLIVVFDPDHLVIADPLGYFLRYGLPVLLIAGLYLWVHVRRHAATVRRRLKIRPVTRADEPRFVDIAEAQCIAQGVRLPRFGVIDAPERNALTVGEGPDRGLIAVTQGLIDDLDDDELAAVLAHEVAHIRHGDTKLLALNHALHQAAVSLSIENPFRFDDWRLLIVIAVLPVLFPIVLVGSIATRFAMWISSRARRSLSISRDFLADAASIRATHDPASLLRAIRKVAGRGEFAMAVRVEGLLFDGRTNGTDYGIAPMEERVATIERLSGDMLAQPRSRRDTRVRKFGHRPQPARTEPVERWLQYGADGRPLARPPNMDVKFLKLYFSDRDRFDDWFDALHAYWEWRPEDRRNFLGIKPKMMIPVAACATFIAIFYWPEDGSWRTFAEKLNPMRIVEFGRQYGINAPLMCEGPSYPDGKCPDSK